MQTYLILLAVVLLAFVIIRTYLRQPDLFPPPSRETVQLNAEKRHVLARLKGERKFEPHDYPPLGYTGVATPEEGVRARAAVNGVIDSILSRDDGPIEAEAVIKLIGQEMKRVRLLETEDRERTINYMIEIWYILGFKGATGRFAHGSAIRYPRDMESLCRPDGSRRRSHAQSVTRKGLGPIRWTTERSLSGA